MSHIHLLEAFLQTDKEYGLIIEDDFCILNAAHFEQFCNDFEKIKDKETDTFTENLFKAAQSAAKTKLLAAVTSNTVSTGNQLMLKMMEKETFDNALPKLYDMMKRFGCANYHVSFFGGEPLLNFDLIKHAVPILHADPKCKGINIISNFIYLQQ